MLSTIGYLKAAWQRFCRRTMQWPQNWSAGLLFGNPEVLDEPRRFAKKSAENRPGNLQPDCFTYPGCSAALSFGCGPSSLHGLLIGLSGAPPPQKGIDLSGQTAFPAAAAAAGWDLIAL